MNKFAIIVINILVNDNNNSLYFNNEIKAIKTGKKRKQREETNKELNINFNENENKRQKLD